MIQLGISLSPLLTSGALGAGAPVLPEIPPATGYYPAVPPVDLAAATHSFEFPEGNNSARQARAGLTAYRALFAQSHASHAIAAGSTAQAVFAIVRLQKGRRQENTFWGIFGNSGSGGYKQWLRYNADGMSSNGGRFRFYQCGSGGAAVDIYSEPWTEEGALVAAWCNGANAWQLDWYSLTDGTRRAGTPVVAANSSAGGQATGYLNIGGAGTATQFTVNGGGGNQWPGTMEAVGYLGRPGYPQPDPAAWGRVALGARLSAEIDANAVRLLREMDGTTAGLTRPAWATGDLQPASTMVNGASAGVAGTTMAGGSTIRRQSTAQYLLFDPISSGQVYGLAVGQTERQVTFAGIGAGFAGPVEVRVFDAETGAVVRDWTEMGPVSAGRWSASMVLPESVNGWLFAEARSKLTPALVAHWRDHFAVGFKFMIMGQSQTQIGLFSGTALSPDVVNPMSASYADLSVIGKRAVLGAAAQAPNMGRVGMNYSPDGLASFLNQFRRFKPKTPVMVYDDAVNGTSMEALLNGGTDGDSDRHWDDISDKLALWATM